MLQRVAWWCALCFALKDFFPAATLQSGATLCFRPNENKQNIQNIYTLLQERKFAEGIKNLQILSEQNDINAQLLYSKILFSGDLTPQDFENSYFWGFSALLGGLKKSSNILDKPSKDTPQEVKDWQKALSCGVAMTPRYTENDKCDSKNSYNWKLHKPIDKDLERIKSCEDPNLPPTIKELYESFERPIKTLSWSYMSALGSVRKRYKRAIRKL